MEAVCDSQGGLTEVCEARRCSAGSSLVWRCVDCDSTYCSDCWSRQGPHNPRKKGRDGVPHEKIDINVIRQIHSALNPPRNANDIRKLHGEDEWTKWFGVMRETSGQTLFEDHGRYTMLKSDMGRMGGNDDRYPQLVSFIGVTNAGKSTIIKLLIQRGGRNSAAGDFPSPVVGSVANNNLTTSSDVHLYIDPATHMDRLPMMLADCEGLEGGERPPLGSRHPERPQQERDGALKAWVNTRPIKWANTEESRTREYAVTALYPRILYTFSDCVVFVLRNPKTFASAALTKLLAWGASALEKSLNQPALPHCIVVLNGTHPGVDSREWDCDYATRSLLSSVSNALDHTEGVPQFRELANYWRGLGRRIDGIEDLILCYYSSFKVIRIPAGPHYMLISQQIDKLHATIRDDCETSHESKRRARLLTDASELHAYLQSGFDHFTAHLNLPFNFTQVSLQRKPIPRDFGDHILQLCAALSSRLPSREPDAVKWTFWELSVMLGSCVLLDCARFRKGRLDELFINYVQYFDYAIVEYLQLYYPCSFVSLDGTRRCKLVRARHQVKGHQDERGIISAGGYESTFDPTFAQEWLEQLRAVIADLHCEFSTKLEQTARRPGNTAISEECVAFAIHVDRLDHFYGSIGQVAWIRSHSTCFCCLMDLPEHLLPCGHALCERCARACGTLRQESLVVSWCPLHRDATQWPRPKVIKYKPRQAGVRVLALDGGGVRGVVQLEILRGIEQALGNQLPVQAFFDLMIGTGTGGLTAVALANKNRSLDECQDMFTAICKHAYTTRSQGLALANRVVRTFGSRPRYEAGPLYRALKTTFTKDNDFFGTSGQFRSDARVAVTANSPTRQKPMLVANYRRAEGGEASEYEFERPHDPAMELKTWQAVSATMADPLYFAPLSFGKHYTGVGLTHVNPALDALAEARKIWPDVMELDMLLSIGTGQNRMAILEELLPDLNKSGSTGDDMWLRRGLKKAQSLLKWGLRGDNDVLAAEYTWECLKSAETHHDRRRLIRFNVDLGTEVPPAQDRESQVQRLSTLVRDKLKESHRLVALRNVAHRLVATSFYLHADCNTTDGQAKRGIGGYISCRFEDYSDSLRRLGKSLNDRRKNGFEPFFLIQHGPRPSSELRINMTSERLSRMINDGVFELPKVTFPHNEEQCATSIDLHLLEHDDLEPEGYPISGFPRVISEVVSTSRAQSHRCGLPIIEKQQFGLRTRDLRSQDTHESQLSKSESFNPRGSLVQKADRTLQGAMSPVSPRGIGMRQGKDAGHLQANDFDECPPPYEVGNGVYTPRTTVNFQN